MYSLYTVCDLSQKVGGRVRKYMHTRAIHNAVTQGRTVQKCGWNPPNPRQITPAYRAPGITAVTAQRRNSIQKMNTITYRNVRHYKVTTLLTRAYNVWKLKYGQKGNVLYCITMNMSVFDCVHMYVMYVCM